MSRLVRRSSSPNANCQLCCLAGQFSIVFIGKTPLHYLLHEGVADEFVFAFKFGVAVLVISCTFALVLATTTAVMVDTGVWAKTGIRIKGGEALDVGLRVTIVIFNKTGTLTLGKPSVADFKVVRGSVQRFSLYSARQNSAASIP